MSTLNDYIYKASGYGKHKVWILLVSRKMISTILVSVALLFSLGSLVGAKVEAEKVTCKSFKSRADAQKAYDLERELGINNLSRLDGYDNDNKVCETTKY